MSRIAVIDLGTNTFNLLIVEVNTDKTYQLVFQTKISVKLGEGGITKGFIAFEPFNRGINALKTHKQTIEKYGVEKVYAIATSAIRGASNGAQFVEKAKEECNIDIQVISGDKEAETIYYGVRDAVEMTDETSLIIDIGGGSTEFIIANKNQIFWRESFLLGVARLLEMFNPSDPITDVQKRILNEYLHIELQPLFKAVKKYPITELIGSSGSFDSLAEMVAHRFYSPHIFDGKTEYTFNLDDCAAVHETIVKSTTAERLQMKGLVAMRVDMIVISSILVHFILKSFSIPKMRLSTYSLKEGLLYEVINLKI
jgi:exopolyphosphatase/guanosine-5'-triphosphate,3'-diphosphate pyrophosphatase